MSNLESRVTKLEESVRFLAEALKRRTAFDPFANLTNADPTAEVAQILAAPSSGETTEP